MWSDCERRQASRIFPIEITDAGYNLHSIQPSVGASVGTGTHTAIGELMAEKMAGRVAPDSHCEDAGITALRDRVKLDGVRWDQVSPNLNTAEKQVRRQYKAYRMTLGGTVRPVEVERRITFKTRAGNDLSGQVDLGEEFTIRDTKTGTMQRSNLRQIGAYSLLRRAEGGKVRHLVEDYVARVAIDKEQPMPVTIEYDIELAERTAARTIAVIEQKYADFRETGDPLTFTANPMSALCGEKWCPAWGSEFCREHKGAV